MRGGAPGLETPHPLGFQLPSVYADDDLAQRFTQGLDEVLAPVVCTLDCLAAYVDPHLAPADFVAWLTGWVGVAVQESWEVDRQRELVASAALLLRMNGTVAGIARLAALYTHGVVEVRDTGGTVASAASRTPPPGRGGTPTVRVTVRGATAGMDQEQVRSLLRAAAPAHVLVEAEVHV